MSDNENEFKDSLYHKLVDADVFSTGMPNIYQGKTPAWRLRFQSWSARMTEMDYLRELVNTRLSFAAYTIMTNNVIDNPGTIPDPSFDNFARGYASGIRAIYGDIVKASGGNKQLKDNKQEA